MPDQSAYRRALLRQLAGFRRAVFGLRRSPLALARGAAVGLLIAFTPTVGFQIPIVMAAWAALRHRWPFSMPAALAWTFVTNVLTAPPLYYLFVLTGRLLLGHGADDQHSFDTFSAHLTRTTVAPNDGWLSGLWQQAVSVIEAFGLPLLVGCIPWALFAAVVGYALVLRVATRRAAKRAARMLD